MYILQGSKEYCNHQEDLLDIDSDADSDDHNTGKEVVLLGKDVNDNDAGNKDLIDDTDIGDSNARKENKKANVAVNGKTKKPATVLKRKTLSEKVWTNTLFSKAFKSLILYIGD